MAAQKILLPYNFTNGDQKALDFVVSTFGHRKDVEVTLFYAYTPAPLIEMSDSPVMNKLRDNLNYLSQKIEEQGVCLSKAKNNLVENGFPEHMVHYIFRPRKKDIACEISDLAYKGRYHIVVINRKPGKITRFFTGSIFEKVVSTLKEKTIFLVT